MIRATSDPQPPCLGYIGVFLHRLVVGVEASYVESSCTHGPGVHRGVLHHVMREIARGILATTVLDGMAHQIEVVP